ncbi:hypothetical protein C8Q70DRAFT_996771 [Cubamyces menziesii]|nr:hypothetical protein C8Q70DRAFT_996771 [Cubamyces menziesii]
MRTFLTPPHGSPGPSYNCRPTLTVASPIRLGNMRRGSPKMNAVYDGFWLYCTHHTGN